MQPLQPGGGFEVALHDGDFFSNSKTDDLNIRSMLDTQRIHIGTNSNRESSMMITSNTVFLNHDLFINRHLAVGKSNMIDDYPVDILGNAAIDGSINSTKYVLCRGLQLRRKIGGYYDTVDLPTGLLQGFSNDDYGIVIYTHGGSECNYFKFMASNIDIFHIEGSGNVGIGYSNPVNKLDVAGAIYASNGIIIGSNYLWNNPNNLLISTTSNTSNLVIARPTGRIGINTTNPAVILDIIATDAIRVPTGTSAQRPSAPQSGYIRYNTTINSFEGYGGTAWGSIGGLKDTNQDTYITMESSPTTNDDTIRFYTSNNEILKILPSGFIGVSNANPSERLELNGGNARFNSNVYVMTRLGISNTIPTEAIDVIGNISSSSNVYAMQRLGVRTKTPSEVVEIVGNTKITNNAYVMNWLSVGTSNATTQFEVNGSAKIGQDLEVMGNMTVRGTTTSINTTTVNIQDNIIQLNSGVTYNPSLSAGIEINRGTGYSNFNILFDEATDYLKVGLSGTTLQTVATREDNPPNQTIPFYDASKFNYGSCNLFIYNNTTGRLGVGTSNPISRLHVVQNDGPSSTPSIYMISPSNTQSNDNYLSLHTRLSQGVYNPMVANNDVGIIFSQSTLNQSTGNLVIAPWSYSNYGIKILGSNGNVGIGTSTPASRLDVNGTITANALNCASNITTTSASLIITNSTNSSALGIRADAITYVSAVSPGIVSSGDNTALPGVGSNARPLYLYGSNITYDSRYGPHVFNNGNVGIGTNNPSHMLHLQNGDIRIDNNNYTAGASNSITFSHIANSSFIQSVLPGNNVVQLRFITSSNNINTNTLTCDGTGNVGIGTSNPISRLHVVQNDGLSSKPSIYMISPSNSPSNDNYLSLHTRLSQGVYNPMVANNDVGIIFSQSTLNQSTGNLVIAPWSYSNYGIKILGSNGNVGIGTSTPASRLDVNGDINVNNKIVFTAPLDLSASNNLLFSQAGDLTISSEASLNLIMDNNSNNFGAASPVAIKFGYGNSNALQNYTEYMRITTTGNVGIGTNAPSYRLHVTGGTAYFPDGIICPGLHAQTIINGGGDVRWSNLFLFWSTRVIVIPGEKGQYLNQGYCDITCPTSGTITYYNNTNTITTVNCTASGIQFPSDWVALYYEITPGQGTSSDQTRFRLVHYVNSTWRPSSNWILLAVLNGDGFVNWLKWIPGNVVIPSGGTYYSGSGTNNWQIQGTSGYIPKFTGNNVIGSVNTSGNSLIYDNGTNVGISTTSPAYKLDVNGSIIASDWIRTRGNNGWYSETWGGGWYMYDTVWIRAYNQKNIYTGGNIQCDGSLSGGTISGNGSSITNLNAANISSGTLPVARGGTGTTTSTGSGSVVLSTSPTITTSMRIAGSITNNPATTDPSNEGTGMIEIISSTSGNTGANQTKLNIGVYNLNSGTGTDYAYLQTVNFWNYVPHIVLQPYSGNVGVGTNMPVSKLHVHGGDIVISKQTSANNTPGLHGSIVWYSLARTNGYNNSSAKIICGYDRNFFEDTGYLAFATSQGTDDSIERMRITANGDVGIGTSSPSFKLDVSGDIRSTGIIRPSAGNSTANGIYFPTDPGGGSGDGAWMRYYARSGEACTLEIGTGNDSDDHIYLNPSGNVGIGTTSPAVKLQVPSSGITTGISVQNADVHMILGNYANGNNAGTIQVKSGGSSSSVGSSNYHLLLNPDGGNVGIGTTGPIYRLDVNGDMIVSNWIRTRGDYGWYSETWGGGWYMNETSTIKAYNDKNVYTGGNIQCGGTLTAGTISGNGASITNLNAVNVSSGTLPVARGGTGTTTSTGSGSVVLSTSPALSTSMSITGLMTNNPATIDPSNGGTGMLEIISSTSGNTGSSQTKLNIGVYNLNSGSTTDYAYLQAINFWNYASHIVLQPNGGNVGIGTTRPAVKLQVPSSGTTTGLSIQNADVHMILGNYANNNNAGTIQVKAGGSVSSIGSTNYSLLLNPDGGNVGIGTTGPAYKLDVNGDMIVSNWIRTRGDYGWYSETHGGGWQMTDTVWIRAVGNKNIYTGGTIQCDGTLSGGNLGIGITSPSYRLHVVGGTIEDWSGYFDNSVKAYIAHRSGYGMHINTYNTSAARYALELHNNTKSLFYVRNDGMVGVGTSLPSTPLHVYCGESARGIIQENCNAWDDGSKIYLGTKVHSTLMPMMWQTTLFIYATSSTANVYYRWAIAITTYFTGQHAGVPDNKDIKDNITDYVGLIVSSADTGYVSYSPSTQERMTGEDAITINECLPNITLSSIDNDPAVFGVISDRKDNCSINTDGSIETDANPTFENDLRDRVRVNSIGEGAIWVSNINGNLRNGDYITSSIIPGIGKRQDDDILHNYTVAKITMSCNFELNTGRYKCVEFDYNGQTYRKAFVGCTYHCG